MRSIAGPVLRDGRGHVTKGFEMSHDKGQGIVRDGRGEEQPADKQRAQQSSKTPAAGPHAKPELTDDSKTPGAGALPEPGKSDDSTSG